MEDLYGYASVIHSDVTHELKRAEGLANQGFFTEAVLRLGRAIECSLYCVAREVNVDLTNRILKPLSNLAESIRGCEVNIIRKKQLDEVRSLANISRSMSRAIVDLASDRNLWEGELNKTPQGNSALLKELIQQVEDTKIKRQLEQIENQLRRVQDSRNQAAHAPLDGVLKEFTEPEYIDLLGEVENLLDVLSGLIIFYRTENTWSPKTATTE